MTVPCVNDTQVKGFASLKVLLTDNRLYYYALSPMTVSYSVVNNVMVTMAMYRRNSQ